MIIINRRRKILIIELIVLKVSFIGYFFSLKKIIDQLFRFVMGFFSFIRFFVMFCFQFYFIVLGVRYYINYGEFLVVIFGVSYYSYIIEDDVVYIVIKVVFDIDFIYVKGQKIF